MSICLHTGAEWYPAVAPPSIVRIDPLTNEKAGVTKEPTTDAISAGFANRAIGTSLRRASTTSGDSWLNISSVIGVSTKPGHTAFDRIPRAPKSNAIDRIRPTTPCLATTYAAHDCDP